MLFGIRSSSTSLLTPHPITTNRTFLVRSREIRGVGGVTSSHVARAIGRLIVGTGGILPSSLVSYVSYDRGHRYDRATGSILSSLGTGVSTTTRLGVPVYRSANVTIVFTRVNRSIRVANSSFRATIGGNISRNCIRKLLEGSIIHSPFCSEMGAGSGAPTIVRAQVIPNSGVGVATTPGNFKDRGVDTLGVFAPDTAERSVVSFVINIIGGTNSGPYPPVILNMNVNNSFRCYTLLTGGTLYHGISSRGPIPFCTRLRGRLLRGVGSLSVKPRNFNNGAATLTIGVRACPARVTKLPITIGIKYRMAERTSTIVRWVGS